MKNLKPIETDAQFKYKCIDPECGSEHWLFLNQVTVKNFKLVCDCGQVYKIKQVGGVRIKYIRKKPLSVNQKSQDPVSQSTNQPEHFNKAISILKHYGFDQTEAQDLVKRVYDITQCSDHLLLVKDALKIFGGI